MDLKGWGPWVFFGVPILLWLVVIVVTKFSDRRTSVFSVLIGTDNRLSLSRGQALAWTLVIFASWTAAMAEHFALQVNHAPGSAAVGDDVKKTQREALANADLDYRKKAQEKADAEDKRNKAVRAKEGAAKEQKTAQDAVEAARKSAQRLKETPRRLLPRNPWRRLRRS